MDQTDTPSPQRPARGRSATSPPSARSAPSAWQRRQQVRRRRTGVLALVLLLGGTVLARTLEDPGDVRAATAANRTPATSSASAAGSATVPATASGTSVAGAPSGLPTDAAAPDAEAEADGSPPLASDTSRLPVPASGDGQVGPVAVPARPVAATGRTVHYSIEVEGGLPVSRTEFARTVATVLTDRRGWQAEDGVRFVPVSPAQLAAGAGVDLRVTLASPRLTARLCAPLDVTIQQVSCWNGSRSVLNLTRWMHGSVTYGDRLADYRIYLISHEVGHGLGHGHVSCPAAGTPAPVMVQQTTSLQGCRASPWPTGT